MKVFNLILNLIYGVGAIYTTYMAIMHLFVYFANQNLGHTESFRLPMIYLVCAFIFGVNTYIGYRLYSGVNIGLILKSVYYLPFIAVGLYILWAILLIISSGGKWN